MKKLLFVALIASMVACNSQNEKPGYTVSVEVTGDTKLSNDTLVLKNFSQDEIIETISVLKDGKCTFNDSIVTPEFYALAVKGEKRPICSFFLENNKYTITIPSDSLLGTTVVGGTTQSLLDKFAKAEQEIIEKANLDSLVALFRNATSDEEKERIKGVYDNVMEKAKEVYKTYIAANPTSQIALLDLSEKIQNNIDINEAEGLIAKFKALPEYLNNRIVKNAEKTINVIKSLQPGNKVPEFTQNDKDGNPIKLSDIYSKNKVTMLDFWASWCGPCRAFNPTLVDIYKKYNKKGLEILGISFDTNKEAWLNAIEKDKLAWPQVSDLGGWKNAAGEIFNVKFIPQNLFVDSEGKILARQIQEDEIVKLLDEKLK